MFAKLKARRARKKYEDQEADFRNGFGWAMAAYFVEGMTTSDLEAHTHGQTAPFDKGADAAISLIDRLEHIQEDQKTIIARVSDHVEACLETMKMTG